MEHPGGINTGLKHWNIWISEFLKTTPLKEKNTRDSIVEVFKIPGVPTLLRQVEKRFTKDLKLLLNHARREGIS